MQSHISRKSFLASTADVDERLQRRSKLPIYAMKGKLRLTRTLHQSVDCTKYAAETFYKVSVRMRARLLMDLHSCPKLLKPTYQVQSHVRSKRHVNHNLSCIASKLIKRHICSCIRYGAEIRDDAESSRWWVCNKYKILSPCTMKSPMWL